MRTSSVLHPMLPRRTQILAAASALALAGVVTSAAVVRGRYWPSGTLPGLKLEGKAVPAHLDHDEAVAYVAERARELRDRKVRIVSAADPNKPIGEATLGELGLVVDPARVAERLTRIGHDGDLLSRAEDAGRARQGLIDVPFVPTVDMKTLAARLRPIKEKEDRGPVAARLDLEQRTIVPERDGIELETLGASASLQTAVRTGSDVVVVPVFPRAANVRAKDLEGLDVRKVLSTYETFFSRRDDQAARSRNIEMAASRLDGRVLSPHEVFSFNALVGDRSEESGFEKSWEILKGEMTEGVGGGTCQVASTFHAAAFFGGLEILQRLPHSRPSAYIPMGLDATVVYPTVDLKIRNPFSFPVVIHTSVIGNRIKVDLLGAAKPLRVRFAREVIEMLPYKRKVVEKSDLHGSEVVLRQHGIRGYRILRKRIFTYRNGKQREELSTNLYPATTEIYEVPPGFDPALLPPLPFHAPDDEGAPAEASGTGLPVAVAPGLGAPGLGAAALPPTFLPTMLAPTESAATAVAATAAPVAAAPGTPLPDCTGDCRLPPAGPTFTDVKRELSAKGFRVTEAKGTHAPTEAQANPTKELEIRR